MLLFLIFRKRYSAKFLNNFVAVILISSSVQTDIFVKFYFHENTCFLKDVKSRLIDRERFFFFEKEATGEL